jgi:Family of unknown function (DUF5989)
MSGFLTLLWSNRNLWLGPIIVTIVIFLALVMLSKGPTTLPFLYRFS